MRLTCIRTRHYAPNTNGVVERFHRSLNYEYLHQHGIANAAELSEEVKAFLATFNEVRPHETLGQRPPLALHREDPHLLRGLPFQDP